MTQCHHAFLPRRYLHRNEGSTSNRPISPNTRDARKQIFEKKMDVRLDPDMPVKEPGVADQALPRMLAFPHRRPRRLADAFFWPRLLARAHKTLWPSG